MRTEFVRHLTSLKTLVVRWHDPRRIMSGKRRRRIGNSSNAPSKPRTKKGERRD